MKFYHGSDHIQAVKKASRIAPSFDHRFQFIPDNMVGTVDNYFLDNGAFTESFNEYEWLEMLEKASDYSHKPDFVVLPDVFDDPEGTWKRGRKYVSILDYYDFDHYYVAQKGSRPGDVVDKALQLGSSGIFIGGSWHKPRITPGFVEEAKSKGLQVHIGMPGDLLWASRSGADSFDTTSIIRNKAWSRLRNLENAVNNQKNLGEFVV